MCWWYLISGIAIANIIINTITISSILFELGEIKDVIKEKKWRDK